MNPKAPFDILQPLSKAGLSLGFLFLAASLTPTLIPRTSLTQGAVSGVSAAFGYMLAVLCLRLWRYLELPLLPSQVSKYIVPLMLAASAIVALAFLWRAAQWQDSIRQSAQLSPIGRTYPLEIVAVSLCIALILLFLGRTFQLVQFQAAEMISRVAPRRVSHAIGLLIAAVLFWSIANGVFFRAALRMLDSSYKQYDNLLNAETRQPASPTTCGGPDSLLAWEQLGRAGREYVVSGPATSAIHAVTGKPARDPIRVYVGLRSADTLANRTKLALDELKRLHAFDRSVLVIVTPTGTGWIDPAAMDSVEYLHGGDIASVALQYSYLSSPLSLLVEPEYGAQSARALFHEIYNYWTTLPRDRRPRLYLHGLSLGSLNSEKSVEPFELIGNPIDGALWSGPTFKNLFWRALTESRTSDSPSWLPRFRDSSLVRFADQGGFKVTPATPWGPMRIVYLQYASDAITFFDYRDLYREPDWMKAPRGPDVSTNLRWYPVVSMLQLALDMAVAAGAPIGSGHVYAAEHYVEAWVAVTNPQDWSDADVERLKQHLAAAQRRAASSPTGNGYDDRGG